jgi:hypothetical protein
MFQEYPRWRNRETMYNRWPLSLNFLESWARGADNQSMTRAFALAPQPAGAAEWFDEKRREPRIPVKAIPARLRASENAEPSPAHVLDISTSGVRVGLNVPLEVGAEATIWFDRTVATGRVRYCRANGAESFEAGLCLTDALSVF